MVGSAEVADEVGLGAGLGGGDDRGDQTVELRDLPGADALITAFLRRIRKLVALERLA